MTSMRMSRRTFAAGAASGILAVAATRLPITAQSTPAAGDSLVTEINGTEIAWVSPWTLNPDKPVFEEVAVFNSETDEEVDTFSIDSIWLMDAAGATAAIYVAAYQQSFNFSTSWNFEVGWPSEEVSEWVLLDEHPEGAELNYGLAYAVRLGEQYGAFYTSRNITNTLSQQRWISVPVETFADQMASFIASVTVDGSDPFPGVDPAGLQALLDAHLASSGGTPEASPAP